MMCLVFIHDFLCFACWNWTVLLCQTSRTQLLSLSLSLSLFSYVFPSSPHSSFLFELVVLTWYNYFRVSLPSFILLGTSYSRLRFFSLVTFFFPTCFSSWSVNTHIQVMINKLSGSLLVQIMLYVTCKETGKLVGFLFSLFLLPLDSLSLYIKINK